MVPEEGKNKLSWLLVHRTRYGGGAILAVHFGDHAPAIGVTDVLSLDDQFVADSCLHHRLPCHRKILYFAATLPRAGRRET
jgi:hypothetical protein